jgi:hypothetical protein
MSRSTNSEELVAPPCFLLLRTATKSAFGYYSTTVLQLTCAFLMQRTKQNGMPSSSRIAELQSLVQQMQVEV